MLDLFSLADRLLSCPSFAWKPGCRILGGPLVAHVHEEGLNTYSTSTPKETGWIAYDARVKLRPDLSHEETLDRLEAALRAQGGTIKPGDCTTRAERLVEAYEDLELDSMEGLLEAPEEPEEVRLSLSPCGERNEGAWEAYSAIPVAPVKLTVVVGDKSVLLRALWTRSGTQKLELIQGPVWLEPGSNEFVLGSSKPSVASQFFSADFLGGDAESVALTALTWPKPAGPLPSDPVVPDRVDEEHELTGARVELFHALDLLGHPRPSSPLEGPLSSQVRTLARAVALELEMRRGPSALASEEPWDPAAVERSLNALRRLLLRGVSLEALPPGRAAMDALQLADAVLRDRDKKALALQEITRLVKAGA